MSAQSLHFATRELRHRLVSLIESLSGLRALSGIHNRLATQNELLDETLRVLMENQDLERCSVFLLKKDHLHCAVGRDWNDQMCTYDDTLTRPPYVFRIGEGIIGQAAQLRQLQHSRNCILDQHFVPIASGDRRKYTGSMICAPIMAGEELLGVLNASHPDPDFFHPWQNNVFSIFCNVLGQMLHYHTLITRMDALVMERTQQLQEALSHAEAMKRQYEELAVMDDLTKLHNRRYFFREAEAELARAIRNGELFSIMLIDVDHFKHINDTHGHHIGDVVLRDAASALRQLTRDGDILARFGGEEFVFALPTTDVHGATQLAQRIRESLRAQNWQTASGSQIQISVSIGLSCMPSVNTHQEHNQKAALQELLRQADVALYYAKRNGRDRVCAFDELPAPEQTTIKTGTSTR